MTRKRGRSINSIIRNSLFSTSLAQAGLKPEDITDVIQTHLHFDHCGGSVSQTDDGKLYPTFPNAKHYVQKENLAWARKPTDKDRASYLKNDWEPLVAEGMLEEIDGPGEIFPGNSSSYFQWAYKSPAASADHRR